MIRTKLGDGFVTLRRLRPADAPRLHAAAMASVAEVHPWMEWCRPDLTETEIESYLQLQQGKWDRGEEYQFGFQVEGELSGAGGINRIEPTHGFANLGYWVRSEATGRGIATAATLLLAQFGFEDIGLNRVEIIVDVDNAASRRVAEKAGATAEGILRSRLYQHGRTHDAVCYSLIPADLGGR